MSDNISENFNRLEFSCGCGCGFDTVDVELIQILEKLRAFFDSPVTINSSARCRAHNRAVGGTKSSQHLLGRAADIVVAGVSPALVQEWVNSEYPDSMGLGSYESFTHIDTREEMARW